MNFDATPFCFLRLVRIINRLFCGLLPVDTVNIFPSVSYITLTSLGKYFFDDYFEWMNARI